jgi:hypothetical protein
MIDRCVERGPERRCQQIPEQPEFAYPIRLRKVGWPYHFSAVVASSEATLRTPNAVVTKNSTDLGRGFRWLAARRASAGAHVTTSLRLPVTRAASGCGKVGASLQAVTHLAIRLYWRAGYRRSMSPSSATVADCGVDWCRAKNQSAPLSATKRFLSQSAHQRHQSVRYLIVLAVRAHASLRVLPSPERRWFRWPFGVVAHMCYIGVTT